VDDILNDFLTESSDNLARLDADIVALEHDPSNTVLLNTIFRTIHTIKGTCGFLGLVRLESVAHSAESVLDWLRAGHLFASPDVISDILRAIDVIKEILAGLERTSTEPFGDDSALIAALDAWMHDEEPALTTVVTAMTTASSNPATRTSGSDERRHPNGDDGGIADASLRVNVAMLDKLMNTVGELVLARNQLIQIAGHDEHSLYHTSIQHLSRITTELQESVMKTRMQPIGTAWSKLPRLVRDIARASGKQITLEMSGATTELDRQVIQAIQDPLTHMVRNSGDHGIELPEVRRARGKLSTGTIRLHAYQESGHVVIEITDDGAGIDPVAVRTKAVERGLVRREVADAMSDRDALNFIFEPGFSTASTVTSLSGRGVGMDVVRSNIERIGGTIDVRSTAGVGCTIHIRIPLTLAIISALVVGVHKEMFAIPQTAIIELVRVTSTTRALVETVFSGGANGQDAQFYRLRDTLLPLIDLGGALRIRGSHANAEEYNIVVCQTGATRFGLIVSAVFDTQEIVVKPVGRRVKPLECYAGCTILGDGRVVMILDPAGVSTIAGVQLDGAHAREMTSTSCTATAEPAEPMAALERLLLFDGGTGAQHAVPLSRVARLEEIPVERIERADDRQLVQYRGALLPLVPLTTDVGLDAMLGPGRTRPVIVCHDGETSLGLAVHEIRDIIEDRITLELASERPGVLGTAVIAGRATEVVDISYYLAQSRVVRPSTPNAAVEEVA